jgi:N utilization substance protein B
VNPSARRNARQYALQAMYQWQLSSAPISDIELEFLVHHIKQKTDLDYFKELIHGIPKDCEIIDHHMMPFLSRPISELDPIELAILRLGIYELAHRLDVPYRVVINEALELAKKFGSIEGYKFVNGILDQAARALRMDEIKADKKS